MSYQKVYHSPIGNILLVSDGEYLTGLYFEGSADAKKHSQVSSYKDLKIWEETEKWLDIYFRGEIPTFTPKYKIENSTPFREEVIEIMKTIPYGTTITYQEIAKEIAKKRNLSKMSSQAVGGAVGWNPICIIIPCHRVVGKDGNLTGYGGGIDHKIELLTLEGNDSRKFHLPKRK